MKGVIISVVAATILATCFFIVHNQVITFSVTSNRITYYFSPQCENEVVEATILSAMNCYNATMGCSYQYISPYASGYSQISNNPWFASLAIFTDLYLAVYLLVYYATTIGLVIDYCDNRGGDNHDGDNISEKDKNIIRNNRPFTSGLPVLTLFRV
jgi:hypothetical protein